MGCFAKKSRTILYERAQYEQAEPLLQRALQLCEQALSSDYPQTAASLNALANLYWVQGKYDQAEPFYLRALNVGEQASEL